MTRQIGEDLVQFCYFEEAECWFFCTRPMRWTMQSKEGRIGIESCEICSKPSLVVVVLYVVLHETIEFWELDALWKVVIVWGEEFNIEVTKRFG